MTTLALENSFLRRQFCFERFFFVKSYKTDVTKMRNGESGIGNEK